MIDHNINHTYKQNKDLSKSEIEEIRINRHCG